MRKFGILLAFILAMLAVLPAAAQSPEVALTLERTACFGACPVYTVTIYTDTDGTVVYNGEHFVDVEGEQTRRLTRKPSSSWSRASRRRATSAGTTNTPTCTSPTCRPSSPR
ncbi:MAG: DUF6438 domain-containing protein [Anaerolineae bacterium]